MCSIKDHNKNIGFVLTQFTSTGYNFDLSNTKALFHDNNEEKILNCFGAF
jgi:hypothetical protein